MAKELKFKDLQDYVLEPVSYFMKPFDDKFSMGMHHHQYFELMYAHTGSFILEIFQEHEKPQITKIEVHPGQFVVLDGFTFHRISIEPNKTAVIYNMEFEPKTAEEYNPFGLNSLLRVNFGTLFTKTNFKQITMTKEGYAVINDTSQVDSMFRKLVMLLTAGVDTLEQACTVALTQIGLFTEISKCLKPTATGALSYIRRANAFIQENFQRKITVTQIAEYVGINHSYLQRQYKKYTGQTMMETIHTLRVQKAATLLTSTNLPIAQIAIQVGFKTKNQLNYSFKQVMGITPSVYKRSATRNNVDHHYKEYQSQCIPVPETSFALPNDYE